ncbi:hypothetical protein GCM10022403_043310 [Streptomyces coacervatus]|uniref:Uncharacterized protein n=1 Tax=Streptomyces coacervatus TaxID=647381 RepID=A0ABP7I1H2_9ACTN
MIAAQGGAAGGRAGARVNSGVYCVYAPLALPNCGSAAGRDVSLAVCGAVVAGRAHAAEPHIDTAPRPFRALPVRQ